MPYDTADELDCLCIDYHADATLICKEFVEEDNNTSELRARVFMIYTLLGLNQLYQADILLADREWLVKRFNAWHFGRKPDDTIGQPVA